MPTPLYKEVKEQIIQGLTTGLWKAGDKLPTEPELAARYGVAVSTIRAAVGELVDANILVRQQGRGTFVSDHTVPTHLYRFFNLVGKDGRRHLPTRQLLSLKRSKASKDIGHALQLHRYGDKADVFRIRFLFRLDDVPAGFADAFVPAAMFPGMSQEALQDPELSLYALYQTRFNIPVLRVVGDIAATAAPPDVMRALRCRRGMPLLEIERTAYTYQSVPVEHRHIWINTGRCRYRVEQGSCA